MSLTGMSLTGMSLTGMSLTGMSLTGMRRRDGTPAFHTRRLLLRLGPPLRSPG